MKRSLNGIEYICGSSLSEYVIDDNNKDLVILENVFVKENLSCLVNIELPYYSCDHLKSICIFCGSGGKNLIKSPEFYPKCQRCKNKKDVPRRKRKQTCASDLGSKKKK